jgi:heme/copper-type cytochrome/quinol oxidase subunit 3
VSSPAMAAHQGHSAEAAHHHDHGAILADRTRTGLWIFLASEFILFGTLLGMYLGMHQRNAAGPLPAQVLDPTMATVATTILLLASMCVGLANAGIRHGRSFVGWLLAAVVLGAVFVGMQFSDYARLWHLGLRIDTNMFGSAFYTVSGLHELHEAFGVLWLLGVLINALRGRVGAHNPVALELAGLYWQFMTVVWLFVFPLVYLREFAA